VFDDVLPPAFGVVVPRGFGERGERVQTHRLRLTAAVTTAALTAVFGLPAVRVTVNAPVSAPVRADACLVVVAERERVRRGQVHEAHRDVRVQRPADRHPLRGEPGQRPERRLARLVRDVCEQRHRRAHRLVRGERDDGVRLGRPLDEQHLRAARLQRGPHGARRARPVVPHAQQQRPVRPSSPRSGLVRHQAPTSRQAR
jgi:hypothetical protein